MILTIKPSPLKTKRFRAEVILEDGKQKSIDFGFKTALRFGMTYIDGATKDQRDGYWNRHTANAVEAKLISGLILSPALLSAYILWGPYRNVEDNKIELNRLLKSK